MYLTGGGGGIRNFKRRKRDQDYAISNQHWVCKFEEIGWDMSLRKK